MTAANDNRPALIFAEGFCDFEPAEENPPAVRIVNTEMGLREHKDDR